MKTLKVVGATAKVQLPEFGIKNLRARVDSGAASCALHASKVFIDEDTQHLNVVLFDPESEFYTGETLVFEEFIERNVRNSFGKRMSRPMVKTSIILSGIAHEVLIGFSDRTKLTYDMLIGRNLLELGYIVDVTK